MGTIGLIDKDVVDLSNLQRQVIHHTSEQTVCELRPPVAATHGIKQKRAGEPP
jgi:molybdopterin/thiamine biosynthesis adenylyltransferase